MKKHTWFWITFISWCLIGTVGSWALIFSPLTLDSKKISEFTVQVNGSDEKNQILVDPAPIDRSLEAITREWEREDWKCLTENLNLASLLLNIPDRYEPSLSSLIRLEAFQNKKATLRLLGLARDPDDHQTYQWVAEIPEKAPNFRVPSRTDFPFNPPSASFNVIAVKTEKMEVLAWTDPQTADPDEKFSALCSSQGFDEKLWSRGSQESVFILQRGSTKLMAIVEHGQRSGLISLVHLEKT